MSDKCYYGVLASSGCVVSSNVYNNFIHFIIYLCLAHIIGFFLCLRNFRLNFLQRGPFIKENSYDKIRSECSNLWCRKLNASAGCFKMLPGLQGYTVTLATVDGSYFLHDHGVYSTKKIRSQFQNIRNIAPPDLFIFIAKRLFTFTLCIRFCVR